MTVESRSETIHIDDNTYIFAKVSGSKSDQSNLASDIVGDTVEVHANIIDASNLYAVAIELEDGAFDDQNKIEFKDFLASVDPVTGIVTFQTQTWIGQVVSGSVLLGFAEETITIDMFMSGEIVEIKGFPTSDTNLQIISMEK